MASVNCVIIPMLSCPLEKFKRYEHSITMTWWMGCTIPDKLSLGCPSQSAQICKQASGGCVWLAVQNCWRGHAWLPGCCPAVWPAEDGRPMEYVFFWPLLAGEFLFNLRFNAIFLPTLLASLNSKRGPKPAHDPFFDPSTKTNNLS